MVKAWIRERAATVYANTVTIDYVGGDPRFEIINHSTISCTVAGGTPYIKQITETIEEKQIKTLNSQEIEDYLATHKILPVEPTVQPDITPDL